MGTTAQNGTLPVSPQRRIPGLSCLIASTALCWGCIARHGIEFGHWARAAEPVKLITVRTRANAPAVSADDTVLLVPALADIPSDNLRGIRRDISREARNYLACRVVDADGNGQLTRFLNKDNLMLAGDVFNISELGRLGSMMGAPYVVGVHVRGFRPYPPQEISLQLVLVDVGQNRAAAEMNAVFDASEQLVVQALSDFLQERRALVYDTRSLESMLGSPAEYSAFVASRCCRALAAAMESRAPLNKNTFQPDNT